MIKIDWEKFIYDYVWFGWYLNHDTLSYPPRTANPEHRGAMYWSRSYGWMNTLWPMRRYGEVYPKWWFKLWGEYDAAEAVDD